MKREGAGQPFLRDTRARATRTAKDTLSKVIKAAKHTELAYPNSYKDSVQA
jgi:hypothetical protein